MTRITDVEGLFRAHHVELYRYLLRFTGGDADLAADATQEAFVTLIERPPVETSHVKAWLFKVGTNAVRESGRTEGRRRELAKASVHRLVPDQGSPVDDSVLARLEAERLRIALDTLSDRDRTILLMREEGFSHREIAEAVGTTTGSVGTMIARALASVAAALHKDGRQ